MNATMKMLRTPLLAASVLLFTFGAVVSPKPQTPTREEWQARIREHQQRIGSAARVFLDASRSNGERLAAIRGIEEFVAEADVAGAARVFLDRAQPAEIRAAALAMIEHAVDRHPAVVTEVLGLAAAFDAAEPLRAIAAKVLIDLSFSSLTMQSRSEELLPALRALTNDPNAERRLAAFGILAAHADDFAQQKLIECVRATGTTVLPRADCIRLLGLRLHNDAYPLLHEVAQRDGDAAARLEAIRLLGGYAPARELLATLAGDRAQSEAVRLAALGTLYANDPEGFPAIAINVVRDEQAGDALRIYGIQAVRQRRTMMMASQRAAAVPPFDQVVAEVARSAKSPRVREAAELYVRTTGR